MDGSIGSGGGGVLAGLGAPTARRGFLKRTGGIAAAAVLGGSLTACDSIFGGDDSGIVLDFSTDFGVLNYAYALEQLEASFYASVVGNAAFGTTFSAAERLVLQDIALHEAAHRDFFAAAIPALGGQAIPTLTTVFTSINFADRTQVLNTARSFEDLGVGAYNGAGFYLRNPTLLTLAGKIVSVEARHASAIRDLLSPRSGAFAPAAFDDALDPVTVLGAAANYIDANFHLRGR
ncbi:MAG TPA: ferritin-like domain-containing protein [Longimicrobium sp.]|nr:ferritin-like domain-containing protein [Longimicrobium sp.]